ncbi:alkaline phosphatase family protein [soil metagenome]
MSNRPVRHGVRRPAAVVTAAVMVTAVGAGIAYAGGSFGNHPLGSSTVGQQADGSYLTQTSQLVTPAGDVTKENGRPFGLALSPDGKTAAALNTGGATTGIVTVFDLVNHTVLQQTGSGKISDGGVLYSPDGKYLWVARPADLQRFTVNPDGTVGSPVTVALPGVGGRKAVPAGLAWAPDGRLLVALSANNTLGVVDPASSTLVQQIPVGNVPNSVAVVGGKVYVSNQGGRPAQTGDQTDLSYGTAIVTNASAVPTSGTVSEVDLGSGKEVTTFPVGLQPSALLVVGTNLLVANSDGDSVTSIDTVKQQLGRTFATNPAPGAPSGATPNGLTMLDPTHLAVSLGRDNAVAVYGYQDAYSQPSFEGLIPTGSFPTGIAEDAALGRLVVGSEQGIGSVGANGTIAEGVGTTPATSHLGYNFVGTVQTIATPTPDQMAAYTQQVFKNNQWIGLQARNQTGNSHVEPVAVPRRVGDPSTIQHVFLIVKENRTYDQVLGDDPRGNGDASLAQFGQKITPNIHALASQFPLIDNLYSDGTNSAEGHHWLDQAFVNNYMQQMYGNYTRSYQTGDPMSNAASGWIWDDALSHGKAVTNWGEQVDKYTDASGAGTVAGSWTSWLHDSQVLDGTASGPLNHPLGTYTAKTDIPSLAQVTKPNFPNFDLNIPDQYRAAMFQQDFAGLVKNNSVPALNTLWVMSDHTAGTTPGGITPEAYVADNDLAVGRIVDTISHSPIWKSSAIFVLEDDSQNGVDHLDGHRNPTLVISPYAKRGAVVHTNYSQLNVMRTIEQILGLPPMNQEDMTAEPMSDVFTDKPDFTPYTAVPSTIALTETNPQPTAQAATAAGAAPDAAAVPTTAVVPAAWAAWSAKQDWSTEDMVNMDQGNRDTWYAGNGFSLPYPGDTKVLLPDEVPGASDAPAPTAAAGGTDK